VLAVHAHACLRHCLVCPPPDTGGMVSLMICRTSLAYLASQHGVPERPALLPTSPLTHFPACKSSQAGVALLERYLDCCTAPKLHHHCTNTAPTLHTTQLVGAYTTNHIQSNSEPVARPPVWGACGSSPTGTAHARTAPQIPPPRSEPVERDAAGGGCVKGSA